MKLQSSLSIAVFSGLAFSHTIFTQLESGGTLNPIGYGIRDPTYDGPQQDVTVEYIACNGGANPTTPSSDIIDVAAGSTVQATWRHTLTSTAANDATYVIDPSHKGPVQAYMKKVTDAVNDVGYGDGWFKVSEAGLTNVATQDWATTDLIAAAGVQSIPIPACIESGQYLLRAEIIALHAANTQGGAQFYMECAQINVVGGTGTQTPSTVSLPGAYTATDPGILINIYETLSSYAIPGPAPFTCGSSGASSVSSAASKAPTSSASKVPTTISTVVSKSSVVTSAVASATASTGSVQVIYGQCGGVGWTGPTVCAAGSSCVETNEYYSQCLA